MTKTVAASTGHYLKPAEMFCGDSPIHVTTVLGSCVSVTMYSPRLRVGAICHGMLPRCRGNDCSKCENGFRYVDCSIRRMLLEFNQRGIDSHEIELKLFGGSEMFVEGDIEQQVLSVGSKNIETAVRVIREAGGRIKACDVGGRMARKIIFLVHTGEVYLNRILKSESLGAGNISGFVSAR